MRNVPEDLFKIIEDDCDIRREVLEVVWNACKDVDTFEFLIDLLCEELNGRRPIDPHSVERYDIDPHSGRLTDTIAFRMM